MDRRELYEQTKEIRDMLRDDVDTLAAPDKEFLVLVVNYLDYLERYHSKQIEN